MKSMQTYDGRELGEEELNGEIRGSSPSVYMINDHDLVDPIELREWLQDQFGNGRRIGGFGQYDISVDRWCIALTDQRV